MYLHEQISSPLRQNCLSLSHHCCQLKCYSSVSLITWTSSVYPRTEISTKITKLGSHHKPHPSLYSLWFVLCCLHMRSGYCMLANSNRKHDHITSCKRPAKPGIPRSPPAGTQHTFNMTSCTSAFPRILKFQIPNKSYPESNSEVHAHKGLPEVQTYIRKLGMGFTFFFAQEKLFS